MVNHEYLNLSNVSSTVISDFYDEYETRIIEILRSSKGKEIEDISYLLVPIGVDNFEVKFGERADYKKRIELEKLKESYKVI
ncbi:hypothetical protein C8E03_102395 [Lachnotalea glycerini]|uniref:Uncharacterized protein n=1 Tax=Lachnotalea glycerini TaxID=1763509 RepID=A0A318EZT3_9FIRM|nr:hypothetical protein [Lachnotalea glycerini]PXV93624.1 hypothetical protein C8E03_102395 [Lachnotalea glycerini]